MEKSSFNFFVRWILMRDLAHQQRKKRRKHSFVRKQKRRKKSFCSSWFARICNKLREERELCYKHRDAYYEAIKRGEIEETNNNNKKKELKRLKALFEKHCPKSWVVAF